MSSDLRDLIAVLDAATKLGAAGAEILAENAEGFSAEVHRARVIRNVPVTRHRVTVRVWRQDGQLGEVSTTTAGDAAEQASTLVEAAMSSAKKGAKDAYAGPVDRLAGSARGMGLEDRRYEGLTPEDKLDVILDAERGARGVDANVLTDAFRYEDWRTSRQLVNTKGAKAEEVSTAYSCSGGVRVGSSSDELKISGGIRGRNFSAVSSLPYGIQMARRAMALLGDQVSLAGSVRVLLPPRVVAELFMHFATFFSERTLSADGNFLMNAKIDDRLHLLDDGTMPGALRSTAFDDRGVMPVPLTLIREGEVHGRFLDPSTARRLETRPTGHCQGADLVPRNLVMRPGRRSMNALLSDLNERVLVVDHFDSLDGLNMATGSFKAMAYGMVKTGTTEQGPVRRLPIRGELTTVLNSLVEVASDTDRHGHIDAPGMILDGFEVG